MIPQHSSKTPIWYTPSKYVEAAREAMGGIDLDPASSHEANSRIVKATKYYTEEENGLEQPWFGRVFLNAPGKKPGTLVKLFWHRLYTQWEARKITCGIWVGFNMNQLGSLQKFSMHPLMFTTCVTDHRISFLDKDFKEQKGPSHNNYFTFVGTIGSPEANRFAEIFKQFGHVFNDYTVVGEPFRC